MKEIQALSEHFARFGYVTELFHSGGGHFHLFWKVKGGFEVLVNEDPLEEGKTGLFLVHVHEPEGFGDPDKEIDTQLVTGFVDLFATLEMWAEITDTSRRMDLADITNNPNGILPPYDQAYAKALHMVNRNPESVLDQLIDDLEHEAMGDSSRCDPLECEMWVIRVKAWIRRIQAGTDKPRWNSRPDRTEPSAEMWEVEDWYEAADGLEDTE